MGRIFRFIKALWKYLLNGKRVPFEKYVSRMQSCRLCLDIDKENWTCKKCGCYVDKKAKMSTEQCPKNMWR